MSPSSFLSRPQSAKRSLRAPLISLASLVLTALIGAGCEPTDTLFKVDYAPAYRAGASTTISILGVFREGRMSPEMWDEISPRVSPAFGNAACPVAYDTAFPTTHHDLAEAVDDYARANGITDDLLDQLAPAATGDDVLVLTIAGRPLQGRPPADTMTPPTAPSPGVAAGRHGALPPPTVMTPGNVDPNAFEMTASLFSVRDHKSVATLAMGYSGQNVNEAFAAFVEKVKISFPGLACAGWKTDVKLDAQKIRDLKTD